MRGSHSVEVAEAGLGPEAEPLSPAYPASVERHTAVDALPSEHSLLAC